MSHILYERLHDIKRCIDPDIKQSRLIVFIEDLRQIDNEFSHSMANMIERDMEDAT